MVETEVELLKRTCQECFCEFEYQPIRVAGREMFVPIRCPKCSDQAAQKQAEREAGARRAALQAGWETICPPLYRDTNAGLLQLPTEVLSEILAWEPNPQGIGLSGSSGAGKTRAMFLLLSRHHFAGTRVVATSAKRFENWCHRMFNENDDARVKIKEAHQAPILFLDDIGKEKYTERVESEFYDLIEDRAAHLRPILWTTNASGAQLETMLGPDRGAPIVRRLREFTKILSV